MFFRGGADTLARYPGVFQTRYARAGMLKLLWLGSLAGGILGTIMAWTHDIPLPPAPL